METEQSATLRDDQEPHPASATVEAASAGTPSPTVGENERGGENNKWELSTAELRRLNDELRAKADAHWNDLLRARAEMDNVRRRAERDVESAHKFALERFSAELLSVRDSLELGLSSVPEGTSADVAKLREGMELTLKMLASAMTKFGVREINPTNERFNPEWHQAMTVQPNAAVPHNTVLMVYQKGYILNERLIRPALVIVSQNTSPSGSGGVGEAQ
ncbi:Protein GrpE [Gammaproteobacteria bacterium]